MKGFDPTKGHTFEAPFIAYHIQRAKAGSYESARWLRDNVRAADRDGRPVDPYVRFLVAEMRRGGLRRSRQLKRRGKRGPGLGDDRQLLLAREMWKQVNVAGLAVTKAADNVAKRYGWSRSSATAAYYRFTKEPRDRHVLHVELKRHILDCIANVEEWDALTANEDHVLGKALRLVAIFSK